MKVLLLTLCICQAVMLAFTRSVLTQQQGVPSVIPIPRNNVWWLWMNYTAGGKQCIVCSRSPASISYVIPVPMNTSTCLTHQGELVKKRPPCLNYTINLPIAGTNKTTRTCTDPNAIAVLQKESMCPFNCLLYRASGRVNKTILDNSQCTNWPVPGASPPKLVSWVKFNKTECYKFSDTGNRTSLHKKWFRIKYCSQVRWIEAVESYSHQSIGLPAQIFHNMRGVADMWWICSGNDSELLVAPPTPFDGLCFIVMLQEDVSIMKVRVNTRIRRYLEGDASSDPEVYLDSVGQPRGIPNQYKA
ncbi:uncharacterized protein LOC127639128 [Xyrauchen texanus]|uniref:uncharacterized protein LOC127639128 n=1 Tax=Xyrauchen texanus TaxID=154827 RepID=UPI002242C103|nr:uncharacterized protein LOC127639128 [Xyrauchen texanus]